jgi:hypothetical protein
VEEVGFLVASPTLLSAEGGRRGGASASASACELRVLENTTRQEFEGPCVCVRFQREPATNHRFSRMKSKRQREMAS